MGHRSATPGGDGRDVGEVGPDSREQVNFAEKAIDGLLRNMHSAGGHDLPALVTEHAQALNCRDAHVLLADLQQRVRVPFTAARDTPHIPIDGTVAGRAYQHLQIQSQPEPKQDTADHSVTVWLPLLNGTERLGVLSVTVDDPGHTEVLDDLLQVRLQRFASVLAEVLVTKTMYGDTIVRLRRTSQMGLAAEVQWSVLPPLTFSNSSLSVAAALEPAYDLAGDSFDYAVDADRARVAVFDGMGHGLRSAQLAALTVAAYRSARRNGASLVETGALIDAAVTEAFHGDGFTTGLVSELDTSTGTFRWINAGHPEPLLLRAGRLVRPLPLDPDVPFGLKQILAASDPPTVGIEQLEPQDSVLLYTDGVVEARSPVGEFFGLQRLVDLVVRNLAAGLPAPETMRRLIMALREHQNAAFTDDATLVLLRWHGEVSEAHVPSNDVDAPSARTFRCP